MKKLIAILALFLALIFGSPVAYAAGASPANMTASSAIVGTQIVWCPVGTTSDFKCTFTQVAAYVYSLMNGDATASGTGGITFATVNSNVGSFGSATNCTSVTVNAKGLVTAASQTACAPPFSAVTGNATLAQLPTLGANSIYINPTGSTAAPQSIAVPACANDGAHGLVYVNGTGLQCASISGSGAVSSVTGSIGVTCSPTTGSVVCSTPATRRDNTATTDTIANTDRGTIVTESNASSVAVTITNTSFVSTDYVTVKNIGVGTATYTPSGGTIDGNATLVCKTGQSADLYFDGTLWKSLANTCGRTQTIAGPSPATLGTTAIASGACATVVTVSATGVATTDVVTAGYNGDPTAVTGYGASATGAVLTVQPYPTANNMNVKVCNSTPNSITPGALTINMSVNR